MGATARRSSRPNDHRRRRLRTALIGAAHPCGASSRNRAKPKGVERGWWGLGRAPHLQGPEGDQSKAAVALGGRSATDRVQLPLLRNTLQGVDTPVGEE